MKPESANSLALIDAMIALLRQSMAGLDDAIRLTRNLSSEIEGGIERPVHQPLKAPETRDQILAARRRAHRSGVPSKIDSDPELRAFIIARIDRLKFTEIAAEVRSHFPPERQTSVSALSRWWQREGQHLTAQPQDKG
jgi:hypothetical protein